MYKSTKFNFFTQYFWLTYDYSFSVYFNVNISQHLNKIHIQLNVSLWKLFHKIWNIGIKIWNFKKKLFYVHFSKGIFAILNHSKGIRTGRCVKSDRNASISVCEIYGWCPTEVDTLPMPNNNFRFVFSNFFFNYLLNGNYCSE